MQLNLKEGTLPLKSASGRLFKYNRGYLDSLVRELEEFLEQQEFMNTRSFSRKVMFNHELKANNNVEGINDSLATIEQVIEDAKRTSNSELTHRIINLYHGYQYILKGKSINSETVAELYKILSDKLLSFEDRRRMGEKYREAPVYILQNGRLDDTIDEGLPFEEVPKFMDSFFEYVNNGERFNNETEYFIKSQIMHFYFVYIHPYFDINGRTSRTVAMWYLLNRHIYPYIIFNRAINFAPHYDKLIKEAKGYHELTKFLEYMLIAVKTELEKEYMMHYLHGLSAREWGAVDYQTVEYLLSMNGSKTVIDYTCFYNRLNDKKKNKDVYETMLQPLIADGTIHIVRETKKYMYEGEKNLEIELCPERIADIDTSMIKRLKL